ncbi:MAG: DUF4349 domain-containing protein [Anaerolineales bacterium]|nr:DUF4349 domain-containing protein [Anaerolineales bacterium]
MKKILPFILLVGFLLTACGTSRQAPDIHYASGAGPDMDLSVSAWPAATAMAPAMEEAPSPEDGMTSNSGNGAASQVQRMVIKNADLAIVVSDVEARMKAINDLAVNMGGYVVSSNLYQSYTNDYVEVPEASVVIRVPSEKLKEVLESITKDTVEVQNENVTSQDITPDYVDLKSRLKNLESAEAQLEDIMKNATETEDVINVFNQLTYYREQIELVKGQMKYYEESVALSAVSVRIIAEETIQPIKVAGWEPKGVARDAIQNLIYFFQDFISFLIYFTLNTLPKLIVISIPLYLVFLGLRVVYRKLRRNKVKPAEPAG